MLDILDTGSAPAQDNMDLDAKLLSCLTPDSSPLLHFYEWAGPSATFGHFIRPEKHFDLKKAEWHHLSLAKRPTGGGIIFHIWDFAFSFLMPASHPFFSLNTLENYQFVNERVRDAMQELFPLQGKAEIIPEDFASQHEEAVNFCMAKPTQYDVVYEGTKIAGAAQRKTKLGYLHQGSISLVFPQVELLKEVLLSKQTIVEAMTRYSFAPLGRQWDAARLKETRKAIQDRLTQKFKERLL